MVAIYTFKMPNGDFTNIIVDESRELTCQLLEDKKVLGWELVYVIDALNTVWSSDSIPKFVRTFPIKRK
jgi:hypothetical protein